jgi:hypothetical protein
VDEAPSSTVGRSSLQALTFAVFFFDYDLDGYPDIFTANGHIDQQIGRVRPKVSYRQAPLLFRNLGDRHFRNVTAEMGAAFTRPMHWRRNSGEELVRHAIGDGAQRVQLLFAQRSGGDVWLGEGHIGSIESNGRVRIKQSIGNVGGNQFLTMKVGG